ncbi:ribonuclease TUDOR 1-like protein [Tanacetum coccineum]
MELKAVVLNNELTYLCLLHNEIPFSSSIKIILLEFGLARLETSIDKIPDGHLLVKVVSDPNVASIKQQLTYLSLKDAVVSGAFNPKNGDLVLAQYSGDKSWNRAMVVNGPSGVAQVNKDIYEVFYIDYGNHEALTYSSLRPMDPSVSSVHRLAQLCQLAYIKVPTLYEKYGEVKGEGTKTMLSVTLLDEEVNTSINAMMLKAGLARLDVRRRWEPRRQGVLDDLEN